jgi:hypothetical protein
MTSIFILIMKASGPYGGSKDSICVITFVVQGGIHESYIDNLFNHNGIGLSLHEFC